MLHDQSVGDQLVVATICSTLAPKKLSASVGPLIIIYLFILFPFVCLLAYLFIGFLVATSLKLGKLHPSVSEP